MEKVLLCYALHTVCTGREAVRIHLRHNSFYPYVNGESVSFIKTVKQCAFGNLCAYTAYFLQLFSAEFNGGFGNLFEINFAA